MTDHKTLQDIPCVRPSAVVAELERLALAAGTDNQRERHTAGLLPEEELLVLARAELFKAFDGLARWHTSHVRKDMLRLVRDKHPACRAKRGATVLEDDALEYETTDLTEASASEWDALRKITAAASITNQHPWLANGGHCDVETLTHWVTCKVCKAEVARSSAKVTILWAGRELVREYAL